MPKHELNYPKKIRIGDITVRDGFQHEEIWMPIEAKLYYLEELILCGIKSLEVTNFGNPVLMPQFKDSEELLKKIRDSKKISRSGINWNDLTLTVVTIRENPSIRPFRRGRKDGARTAF